MKLRTRYTQRLPTAPGLVLDIPMFEGSGTKVLDVSGKGNHGTITDALWTRDVNGVAMSFNGTSAYINCGNDPSLNTTDAIAIEAGVKFNSFVETSGIVRKGDMDWDTMPYGLIWRGVWAGDKILMNVGDDSPITYTYIATDTLTTNTWYHIVGIKKPGNLLIYTNGIEKSKSWTYTGISNNLPVEIGKWGAFFNGTIDEVRIYAVALTAEQIKRRYEQTKRDYVRGS